MDDWSSLGPTIHLFEQFPSHGRFLFYTSSYMFTSLTDFKHLSEFGMERIHLQRPPPHGKRNLVSPILNGGFVKTRRQTSEW